MISASPAAILQSRYSFRGDLVEGGALPTLVVVACFAVVMLAGVAFGLLSYNWAQLGQVFVALGVLWVSGIGMQTLGLNRSGRALKAFCVYLLFLISALLASAVLAIISGPYADAAFVSADHVLFGFDWKTDVPAMTRNHTIGLILSYAYVSLHWQPLVLIVYFFSAGMEERFWQVLTATSITLAVCLAIFPFCPALGGYVHFHMLPGAFPNVKVASAWHYPDILQALKSGGLNYIETNTLEGVVAMPSFHASSAIIFAWAFWSTRLRWPFLILNLTMLVSTVPIGSHYIVDVVAGSVCAAVALWFATRPSVWWSRIMSRCGVTRPQAPIRASS